MSIYDNIRMGKKDATKEQVLHALKEAQCMDIIEKMPQGIDTVIGTRGTYVSGGEAQRLSIARAMLKDAPMIMKSKYRKHFRDCQKARPLLWSHTAFLR